MRRKSHPWRRRLLGSATVVSLVLGLVIALLWARSYWWWDTLRHSRPRPDGEEFMYVLMSERGEVEFQNLHWGPAEPETSNNPFAPEPPRQAKPITVDRPAGFFANAVSIEDRYRNIPARLRPRPRLGAFRGWLVREGNSTLYGKHTPGVALRRWVRIETVVVPYWMLLAPALVFPLIASARALRRRWRARQWRMAGHCPVCGYDLRATPDRCPECGAAPQPPHNLPKQRTAAASSGAVE
jgi:hypothetical protein